ncbi:MAG: hypothetical protein HQM10_20670 [Candidatus Riflebacteria bacterium]|nr:hypothetical protein [Candidatus Riflebacteria bacterium]
MSYEKNFVCPISKQPCSGEKCAWWGKKESNCAVRVMAKMQSFAVDPLEEILFSNKK